MWKRALILLEVVVLFAPATMLLLLGPIGVFAALGQSLPLGLVLMVWVALGAFGGYAVLNLTAHALDSSHALPTRRLLNAACGCGVAACLVGLWTMGRSFWSWPIFGAPILGVAHLLYLAKAGRSVVV
jgi:hypothetical protein